MPAPRGTTGMGLASPNGVREGPANKGLPPTPHHKDILETGTLPAKSAPIYPASAEPQTTHGCSWGSAQREALGTALFATYHLGTRIG